MSALRLIDSSHITPKTLFATTLLACLTTPVQHSLLLHTISWTALFGLCAFRTRTVLAERPGRWLAYSAGLLLAVGQLCERAFGSENVWWTQVLLPLALQSAGKTGIFLVEDGKTWSTLVGLTVAGLAASYHTILNTLTAFGLSYVVLSLVTLTLIEKAFSTSRNPIYSTSGLLAQVEPDVFATLQDISLVAGGVCLVTAMAWEPFRFDGLAQWGLFGRILGDSWIPGQSILSLVQALLAIVIQIVYTIALASQVHTEKLFSTSFVLVAAFASAAILSGFTFLRLWFGILAGLYLYILHEGMSGLKPRVLGIILLASLLLLVDVPASATSRFLAPMEPLPPGSTHPMAQLIESAQAEWSVKVSKQSRTLDAAVLEYKRRHGINPPPNFDKWFEFAMARDVKMIDEYDNIYHSLLPFWGVSPATIRARVRESIGNKANNLLGLLIRDGKIVHVENADDWQQRATVGLIENYVQYLPDMDLAFNIHDEPRVVVPAGGLEQLVLAGQAEFASVTGGRTFTRPPDLNNGKRIDEVKYTRFNSFGHQPTWGPAVISCPVDTPVGSYREASDNLTSYSLGGYIYNHTAFTDVCNSPSLKDSHGFFERANAFNVVHDLYPIFSQSKMSSFQDIVYPSVWYWYDKTVYHEIKDPAWEKKENMLYWRGSTTGGYSRDGGWRKQHRQQLVKKLSGPFDVRFSTVKQCDDSDCAAMKEYFELAEKSDQQDAWKYKYLLDMDGNAYSGRFYAFLKSHSLVFKMAVFREWHEEWIKPWVHYIPLSLRGDDAEEAVKWIDGGNVGAAMAKESSEWARATLRREDYETWMFRMLLEYGRVVDDERQSVGFS